MVRICSFLLGAAVTLTLSACGSDEGTGSQASGGSGGSGTGVAGGASKGGSTNAGGNAAAGGSGGANSCQAACQKVLTANCGDVTQAACSGSCGPVATCASEVETYYSCIAGRGMVSCGTTMNSLVAGCDAEVRTLDICSVCDPVAGETACSACSGTSCCAQLKAYFSSADVDGFYDCVSVATCTTQACLDTCVGMYPTAGKAYNDLNACESKSCLTTCVCPARSSDTPCTACVKASCCQGFGALINAPDYNAFNSCLTPCANTDVACFDACVARFPIAGAAYDALDTTCLATTCSAACGG